MPSFLALFEGLQSFPGSRWDVSTASPGSCAAARARVAQGRGERWLLPVTVSFLCGFFLAALAFTRTGMVKTGSGAAALARCAVTYVAGGRNQRSRNF